MPSAKIHLVSLLIFAINHGYYWCQYNFYVTGFAFPKRLPTRRCDFSRTNGCKADIVQITKDEIFKYIQCFNRFWIGESECRLEFSKF